MSISKQPFTLLEVLVVPAITAAFAALLFPAFFPARAQDGEPHESCSMQTVKHSGHWWVVGQRWGAHHPDCPCCKRTAEAK